MPNELPHDPYLVPQRRPFPWRATALFGVGALAAVGFLVAFAVFGSGHETELAFRPTDRQVVLTASEVEPFLDDFLVRIDGESIRRYRDGNQATIIEYAYDHPDPAQPLMIRCKLFFHESPEVTAAQFATWKGEIVPLLAKLGPGIGFEPDLAGRTAFGWQDNALYGAITKGGKDRGGCLIAHSADRVFQVIVYGVEQDAFATTVADKLNAFKTHVP